jgi:hypothetical protein
MLSMKLDCFCGQLLLSWRRNKEKKNSKIPKHITIGGFLNKEINYYLDSNVEECLNIYEEIASFCSRFDKAYHNLTIEDYGYSIWLVVSSVVTEDFITKKLDEQLNDKSRSILFNQLHNSFGRYSSDSKFYTKKFREEFFGRSLYEIENGIYIKTFDWNSVTKGVYNTNSSNFDKSIESTLSGFNDISRWSLGKYGYKAEFRELKEEDIKRLKEDREIEFAKRYIGTKAIIVKFDYDKVFEIIKKELKND